MLALSSVAVRWIVRPLPVLANAAEGLGQDLDRPKLPEEGRRPARGAASRARVQYDAIATVGVASGTRPRSGRAVARSEVASDRMRLRADLLDDDELLSRFEADLKEMEAMVTQTLEFMRGLGGNEPEVLVDINILRASMQSDNETMGRKLLIKGQAS